MSFNRFMNISMIVLCTFHVMSALLYAFVGESFYENCLWVIAYGLAIALRKITGTWINGDFE